jgi:hypothetical protein
MALQIRTGDFLRGCKLLGVNGLWEGLRFREAPLFAYMVLIKR